MSSYLISIWFSFLVLLCFFIRLLISLTYLVITVNTDFLWWEFFFLFLVLRYFVSAVFMYLTSVS